MRLGLENTYCDEIRVLQLAERVAPRWKGAPLGAELSLAEFGKSGLHALGDLPMPQLLLSDESVRHNVSRMASYAIEHKVLLAPHSKTTMSPELAMSQLRAGCWALTAATPAHVATLRSFGVQRILLANQLVETVAVDWIVDELGEDPQFEFISLIDSVEAVEILDHRLAIRPPDRPFNLLLEIGLPGGRCGVRSFDQAESVARAVRASRFLQLIGVEFYEGLSSMNVSLIDRSMELANEGLKRVREIAHQLHELGLLPERIVSAGGSAFFDKVLENFSEPDWTVVLRSGCYISQDGGFYDAASPLASRGAGASPLRNSLELWGAVLSRPEPDLLVVGVGRRDAPFDAAMPMPVEWRNASGSRYGALCEPSVDRLNDQHMTVKWAGESSIRVGDLVRFDISHPCGAFDRWRVIPLVSSDKVVTGVIHTIF